MNDENLEKLIRQQALLARQTATPGEQVNFNITPTPAGVHVVGSHLEYTLAPDKCFQLAHLLIIKAYESLAQIKQQQSQENKILVPGGN